MQRKRPRDGFNVRGHDQRKVVPLMDESKQIQPQDSRQSSSVRVRRRLPELSAIHWTADNREDVYRFVERCGWTTRYMSGQGETPSTYLHPQAGRSYGPHVELTVRQGDWIVQGILGQTALVVVPDERFRFEYDLAEALGATPVLRSAARLVAGGSMSDWTVDPKTGRSNSSERFVETVAVVERLIRSEASSLIAGRADQTAGLIVATLAHTYNMAPRP
jgi:hypothetical protein